MSGVSSGQQQDELLKLTGDIVAAFVSKNSVQVSDLPAMIKAVHATLGALNGTLPSEASAQKPAVPIKKSVTDAYVVCLEDGKKLKMLKRYLRSNYNLTPEEYRAKWGLPADYPMVALDYAALCSTAFGIREEDWTRAECAGAQ